MRPNGGTPEIFASDFTNIIDIAFGPNGSIYILHISSTAGAPAFGGTSSLIRVASDGTKTTVVAAGGDLVAPGDIAVARDGSIYVTNYSTSPTLGTVVKIIP